MIRRRTACQRHRPSLLDLVDRGERGPGTAEALDHLAVCHACEQELTEVALTIAALRRTGSEVRAASVPAIPDADVRRLAVRPQGSPRDSWSWRLQLGSLVAGAAIAAVAVAPWVGVGPRSSNGVSIVASHPVVNATWLGAEARLAARPDHPSRPATISVSPRYPEGLSRPWEEVPASDATPREFEPS
jgi:anti-sigma factor RsiW